MDETAKCFLDNKEYELKRKESIRKMQKLPQEEHFFVQWVIVKIRDTVTLDSTQECNQNMSRKNLL